MSHLNIAIEIEAQKGTVIGRMEEEALAEMHFSLAGERLMIIDHTHVDDTLRGQGAGRELLNTLVNWARAHKRKIIPLCPFAKSVFEKDPAIHDVLGP